MGSNQKFDVAVIGAGIAGLWTCKKLRRAGFEVALIDKSRGLGGRMATRRAGTLQFDHGAQFFTASKPAFLGLVSDLVTDDLCAKWFGDRYVATPRMSAIGRGLLDNEEDLYLNQQVRRIQREANGWFIEFEQAGHDIIGNGHIKNIVVAVPAPQAIDIIDTEYSGFEKLKSVQYAPCWTLMLALEKPLQLDDVYMEFPDGHALRSISQNSSKPGRGEAEGLHTIVVHASQDWSIQNLEHDKETVQDTLLSIVSDTFDIQKPPHYIAAHRWRFAEVTQAAKVTFLWNSKIGLGACGDWCTGPRIELAFESGNALANEIIMDPR